MRLGTGDRLRIVNTYGSQVVDLWAMAADDVLESMSMPHSRNPWYRLAPRPGDVLVTNLRRPILRLLEDSSPGVHDTLIPRATRRATGSSARRPITGRAPTTSTRALRAIGVEPPRAVPNAVNLWMNVVLQSNGDDLDRRAGVEAGRPRAARGGDGLHRRPLGLPARPAARAAERHRLHAARRRLCRHPARLSSARRCCGARTGRCCAARGGSSPTSPAPARCTRCSSAPAGRTPSLHGLDGLDEARAAPGVVAVLTAADLAGLGPPSRQAPARRRDARHPGEPAVPGARPGALRGRARRHGDRRRRVRGGRCPAAMVSLDADPLPAAIAVEDAADGGPAAVPGARHQRRARRPVRHRRPGRRRPRSSSARASSTRGSRRCRSRRARCSPSRMATASSSISPRSRCSTPGPAGGRARPAGGARSA